MASPTPPAQQTAGPGRPFAEENERIGVFGVVRTGLLVVCAVLVTTAGACRDEEPDGPPPTPTELSGTAFPDGAETSGVVAVLSQQIPYLTNGGKPCYFIVSVSADGSARSGRGCSDLLGREGQVGDYGLIDGRLTVRTVEWGFVEGSYELVEYVFGTCADVGPPDPDARPGDGGLDYNPQEPWQLVDGAIGAEAATDDSCWSVTRDVRWIGV